MAAAGTSRPPPFLYRNLPGNCLPGGVRRSLCGNSCPPLFMRLISLLLFVLLLAIQYPLWLGKGGWLRVWDLNRQLTEQGARNQTLKLRNAKLEGEVADLQDGTGAIEERARYELGMVREGEVFVQFVAPAPKVSATPPLPPPPNSVAGRGGH
ncbi:Septum formation initiator [Cupriavidus taiwanensis LMG 19424]|uniref:Cell division protein FtsB n=3 Tax=Cupriavidus TaxID=106589 RepID=B3R4A0_CUPTR|nr:Septum formation initiator [Cupriavidus taiwanensis LMG 19424]